MLESVVGMLGVDEMGYYVIVYVIWINEDNWLLCSLIMVSVLLLINLF